MRPTPAFSVLHIQNHHGQTLYVAINRRFIALHLPSDCAVCMHGYAPGYSHTCKSCFGHRRRRAMGVMAAIVGMLLVVVGLGVMKLVSVVGTTPETEHRVSSWGLTRGG